VILLLIVYLGKLVSSSVVKLLQHNPGGMVVTSVVQWYLRLFCFGKVKCYHIGCLNNGKFCLVYPA